MHVTVRSALKIFPTDLIRIFRFVVRRSGLSYSVFRFTHQSILLIAVDWSCTPSNTICHPIERWMDEIQLKYKMNACNTYVDGDASHGEQFHCWILLWQISIEFAATFVPFHRVECIIFQIVITY